MCSGGGCFINPNSGGAVAEAAAVDDVVDAMVGRDLLLVFVLLLLLLLLLLSI